MQLIINPIYYVLCFNNFKYNIRQQNEDQLEVPLRKGEVDAL